MANRSLFQIPWPSSFTPKNSPRLETTPTPIRSPTDQVGYSHITKRHRALRAEVCTANSIMSLNKSREVRRTDTEEHMGCDCTDGKNRARQSQDSRWG